MLSPAVRDVLQEMPTANGGRNWPLDDTATTLAEGTYAFTATETSGSKSSVETAPFRVKVDRTAPAVTLTTDATTYDLTPEVGVVATDLNGIADGTTVTLDVDLNNDGDFADTGETGYASSTLTGGLALFELTPALALGTVKLRARVTDKAGNEGTSSTQTVTLASSGSGWTTSDATLATDPLQGDALLAEGSPHLDHHLDLDTSPSEYRCRGPFRQHTVYNTAGVLHRGRRRRHADLDGEL